MSLTAEELDPTTFHLSGTDNGLAEEDVYDLPVGYVDREGKFHKRIIQKQTFGKAEAALHSKTEHKRGRALTSFLGHIVSSVGTHISSGPKSLTDLIHDMWITDRTYMLFKARIFNLGPEWRNAPVRCPSCNYVNKNTVDLNTYLYGNIHVPGLDRPPESEDEVVELLTEMKEESESTGLSLEALAEELEYTGDFAELPHYFPADEEERERNEWEITLPVSQVPLTYRLIKGSDEKRVQTILNRGQDELDAMMKVCITSIDGNSRINSKMLKALPWKDRIYFREMMTNVKPGGRFDLRIILDKCVRCGMEDQETVLNFELDSFFSLSLGR